MYHASANGGDNGRGGDKVTYEIKNTRLRSVDCEDPRGESRLVDVPYSTRGWHVSKPAGHGGPRSQGTSSTLPPPLVVVQTPEPRPLALKAYFRMVDRRKITVEF